LSLRLMPERAVFDSRSSTLLVADVHLGKAAVFRARGIPVPQGTTTATLARLSQAVERCQARRLVVLGDLLHAKESHAPDTMAVFRNWRQRHAELECWVVEGNHDRHAGALATELGFHCTDEFLASDWCGMHGDRPRPSNSAWVLEGHVHPVVHLRSSVDRLRLPCFWLHGQVLTLPAFGEFTGGHVVGPPTQAAERLFVVSKTVNEMNRSAVRDRP
jgi:DNA ligase-associated metallophosphoesterase